MLSPEPYSDGDPRAPKTLFLTREAFEILLRRLVIKSRPNVEFVTGTVTGYIKGGLGTLSGINVRKPDAEGKESEEKMEGAFVVGESRHSLAFNFQSSSFFFPSICVTPRPTSFTCLLFISAASILGMKHQWGRPNRELRKAFSAALPNPELPYYPSSPSLADLPCLVPSSQSQLLFFHLGRSVDHYFLISHRASLVTTALRCYHAAPLLLL